MMYCFLLVIDGYDFVVLLWYDLENYCYVVIRKYYYLILCTCILCPINIIMIHDVYTMIQCMMSMNECECNMTWYV